jgi:uncharacterized protein
MDSIVCSALMEVLVDGPAVSRSTFVFSHGAGGPMDNAFMTAIARGIADRGVRVVRFEFPYMAARRGGKKTGAPDREPVLLDAWREIARRYAPPSQLVIGGKSLGGRMASMVADELGVAGLVCFGYPFHPQGQPQKLRTRHLESLSTPALFIQGTRDPLGNEAEVPRYRMAGSIRVEWIPDGDHSFKPRVRSGLTEQENLARAAELASEFILSVSVRAGEPARRR